MDLAKIQLARSIWLFDVDELNPHGANLFPDMFVALIKRYGFQRSPKAEDYSDPNKGRKYEDGRFAMGDRMVDVSLELWRDGLVADTRHSTEASDLFLSDFVGWLSEMLGVSYPSGMTKKRGYRSELTVYSDPAVVHACEKFSQIAQLLGKLANEPIELDGLVFGSEARRRFFTFERRDNEPFDSNKFFSTALLKTGEHLALLNVMEETLKAG